MIRYKVHCKGIIGHECRKPRTGARPAPGVENLLGTFLFKRQTEAEACAAELRRLGFDPHLTRLLPAPVGAT